MNGCEVNTNGRKAITSADVTSLDCDVTTYGWISLLMDVMIGCAITTNGCIIQCEVTSDDGMPLPMAVN